MRPLGFLLLICLAGCGSAGVPYVVEYEPSFRAARLTDLSDAACRGSLSAQVASVLEKEGETSDAARMMTTGLFADLQRQTEPGPFFTFSPGGFRYGFFLQATESGCVLRLYERRQMLGDRGLRSMNTLDYLASRTVLYCACSDPDEAPGRSGQAHNNTFLSNTKSGLRIDVILF
ncbi:MAG TPA: hypothetical protein VGM86_20815 [Thermoanaerobaculia bacterium]|jgi:hypothetical protein